jgi:3'-phosphoadenosine 5'-phosphosulfate sulfotransferase (PAPS reductase)/FAD synthetase
MPEPVLRAADLEAWDLLQRTAEVHAQTKKYRRALERARAAIEQAFAVAPPSRCCCMWSGGKDSTVLTHLLRGSGVAVASEKDDLDYPGEREYIERLAREWGIDLTVLVPPVSPRQWLADHAGELSAEGDMHSRAAGLSRECFYKVVEEHGARYDLTFLGLRSGESAGRAANRATHGVLYKKSNGRWICNPLSDWSGLDVFAYAAAHRIELLPVYRCIALLHKDEPWRVRKSWWLPGADARWGGVAWLRWYWPSLYRQLESWMPDASRLT